VQQPSVANKLLDYEYRKVKSTERSRVQKGRSYRNSLLGHCFSVSPRLSFPLPSLQQSLLSFVLLHSQHIVFILALLIDVSLMLAGDDPGKLLFATFQEVDEVVSTVVSVDGLQTGVLHLGLCRYHLSFLTSPREAVERVERRLSPEVRHRVGGLDVRRVHVPHHD